MKVEIVKERMEKYQEYIKAYESYDPKNLKQDAIKLYAELGNVQEVASRLNDKGYRKEGKLVAGKRAQVKLLSNDVTEMLNSEVEDSDLLHPFVKRALNKNRRRKGIII